MEDAWLSGLWALTYCLLALSGALGVLAVVSPACFARVAQGSGYCVDTSRLAQFLERPIDIDQAVLRYSRILGLAVVASSIWLTYVCTRWSW